jgi:two-component system cell cycle response regulator
MSEGSAVLGVGLEDEALAALTDETAEDLLGAIARLADGGVDVVVLSLGVPEGLDALRTLRERAPDVPVIAVGGDVDAGRALDNGASDVLPADASPELLRRAIRYASSIRRMEAELHRRQVVDELTGLYNARGFEQLATHHLAIADRSKQPVNLVFVRLDALDELDTVADAAERERLVGETAAVLREAVRASDVIARVGAGSFCVLLTGETAGAEPLVLSRLVEAVAASNARSGRTAQLSLSVGAAAYDPEHPIALSELMAEADRKMRPGA